MTILFVLGIVGWGFFAIDRLTESEHSPKAKIQGRALGQEPGWKKTVRDWLTKKLSSGEKSSDEDQSVSRNISLEPEPKGLKRERADEEEGLIPDKEAPAAVPDEKGEAHPTAFLFYRLNSKGQAVLSRVERNIDTEQSDLRSMVSRLIKGPSMSEIDKDYIDSFIRKPRILEAGIAGKCAYVDFDANFGAGVSYQTLRFQIQQIFRNIEAWKGVHCLELRVQGRYSPHLGSDGLYFPKRIDADWLKQNL